MPTARKKQIVNNLMEKLEPAKAVVFSDFSGLSAVEIELLRNKLEEQAGHFTVTKNTLLNIACQRTTYGELDKDIITGPTATLFCPEDPIPPIKTLYEYSKENENLKIKGGFLEKRALSTEEVLSLARLPGKEVLLAQLMGTIQAPVRNFACVLNAGMRDLVSVLGQIGK